MFRGIQKAMLMVVLLVGCTSGTVSTTSLPAPVVSLSNMPDVAASTQVQVKFATQIADGKTMASFVMEYASDGLTFIPIANIKSETPSYLWTTPSTYVMNPVAKIRITVTDSRGLVSQPQISNSFRVLHGPQMTVDVNSFVNNLNSVTFSGNCTDSFPIQYFGGIIPSTPSEVIAHYNTVQAPACVAGRWSLTINESSLSYIFSYTLRQSDQLGNSSTVYFTWTRSTQGPIITANSLQINQVTATSSPANISNRNLELSLNVTDAYFNVTDICIKKTSINASAPVAPSVGDLCFKSLSNINTYGSSAQKVTASQNIALDIGYSIGILGGTYKVFIWFKDSVGNLSALGYSGSGGIGTDTAIISYNPATAPQINNIIVSNKDQPSFPIQSTEMAIPSGTPIFIKWNIVDANSNATLKDVSLSYTTDNVNYTSIATGLSNGSNGGCTVGYTAAASTVETGCYTFNSPSSSYVQIRITATNHYDLVASASSAALNTGGLHWLAGNTDLGAGGSGEAAVFNPTSYYSLVVASDGSVYFRDTRGILKIDSVTGAVNVFLKAGGTQSVTDGTDVSQATLYYPNAIALDYNENLLVEAGNKIFKVNLATHIISTLIGGGNTALTAAQAVPAASAILPFAGLPLMFQPLPNGDLFFEFSAAYSEREPTAKVNIYHANQGSWGAAATVSTVVFSGQGSLNMPTRNVSTIYSTPTLVSYPNTSGGTSSCTVAANQEDFIQGYSILFNTDSTKSDYSLPKQLNASVGIFGNGGGVCLTDSIAFDLSPGSNLGADISSEVPAVAGPFMAKLVNGDDLLTTSRFNARNGDLYAVDYGMLYKYDPNANQWNKVLGNGTGHCNDGTLATACSTHLIDAYVTLDNEIYFVDAGQIRTIDSAGLVQTVFGQSKSAGDGQLAITARFNTIPYVDITALSRKIIVADTGEALIREFTQGGTINTIAGTRTGVSGGVTLGSVAANSPVNIYTMLAIPSVAGLTDTDDLVEGPFRLNRSTGKWEMLGGTKSGSLTPYETGDGVTLSSVSTGNSSGMMIGMDPTAGALFIESTYANPWIDSLLKSYSLSSFIQKAVAGITGPDVGGNFCNDTAVYGTVTDPSTCIVPYLNSGAYTMEHYDSVGSRWLVSGGSGRLISFKPGTPVASYYLSQNIYSFNYVSNSSATTGAPQGTVYFCAGDGRVYKSTVGAAGYNSSAAKYPATALPWPIDSNNHQLISCAGGASMIYDPANGSNPDRLIFPITQNGLSAVVEYVNP